MLPKIEDNHKTKWHIGIDRINGVVVEPASFDNIGTDRLKNTHGIVQTKYGQVIIRNGENLPEGLLEIARR